MIRGLRLLLLLGALIGLFGQTVVYAAGSGAAITSADGSQMSSDCMEMMQQDQPGSSQQHGKRTASDCMTALCCIVVMPGRWAPTSSCKPR